MDLEQFLATIENENLIEHLSPESQEVVKDMVKSHCVNHELSPKEYYQFLWGAYKGYQLALKVMVIAIKGLKQ